MGCEPAKYDRRESRCEATTGGSYDRSIALCVGDALLEAGAAVRRSRGTSGVANGGRSGGEDEPVGGPVAFRGMDGESERVG